MANLFAFRATEPSEMKKSNAPIGRENETWLKNLASKADLVVAAWGNNGSYLGRSEQVKAQIPNMYCLKINKSGEPAHPLYQAAKLMPVSMGSDKDTR